MKNIVTLLFLAFLVATVNAADDKNSDVGKQVLAHYAKQGDTLKMKAAKYIVENMPYHYSCESETLNDFYNRVNQVSATYKYPKSIEQYQAIYEDVGDIGKGKRKVCDTQSISSQALIDNIDAAFNDWRNGHWAKHLSFEQFCEFMLPYRVGSEHYESWRANLRTKFLGDVEKLSDCDERTYSAYWAARYVCDALKKFNFHMDDKALPHTNIELPISTLLAMGMGECSNYARLTTYIMRACGIPVCYDYTPQWPNKAHHHSWNALLNNNGKIIPFVGSDVYPGETERSGEKLAKVYRRTFAYQPNSAFALRKDTTEKLPPTFDNPFMADVSNEYFNGASLTLDIPQTILKRQFVYLAVFDNSQWSPVAFAEVDTTGKALFGNVGREIVYLPVLWGRNGSIPCGNPILVKADGSTEVFVPNKETTVTITMERKYPVFGRIYDFAKSMRGGWFEASDSADFKTSKKMAEVTEIPSTWYNSVKIEDDGHSYRYWRYKAPNGSKGNVAELEFLCDGKELPIAKAMCDDERYNKRSIDKATDKDKLSYYASLHQRGAWTGVDMGKPVRLTEIRFMPRNDDNHIENGHIYSLCYYENGKEKTFATTTATSEKLTFKGVPSNALYILHDLTGGTEERIFSVENGNIIWY